MANGFQVYEYYEASDFWWWYLTLDLPDELMSNGEILYQWVTLIDMTGYELPYSIGCKTVVGEDGNSQIDLFTQDANTVADMFSTSVTVYGQTWDNQAASIKDENFTMWTAGEQNAPEAPASTVEGNTNHACYFSKEFPKIGRDYENFDKQFDIYVGARIYANDSATSFTAIPEVADTIELSAPTEFAFRMDIAGACSLVSSTAAAITVVFMSLSF